MSKVKRATFSHSRGCGAIVEVCIEKGIVASSTVNRDWIDTDIKVFAERTVAMRHLSSWKDTIGIDIELVANVICLHLCIE